MSNARELLELAAKAAGYEFQYGEKHTIMGEGIVCDFSGIMYVDCGLPDHFMTEWNPLTDDGDALRLAVKLEINILPSMEECSARNPGYSASWHNELATTDPYAATRRAIVRAAAEMGRAMP